MCRSLRDRQDEEAALSALNAVIASKEVDYESDD